VFDAGHQAVRRKGHTVTVVDGADPPRRLERLLSTLARLFQKYTPASAEPS
jgi:translation initiation factor 1 (eIF-1/SUI1)